MASKFLKERSFSAVKFNANVPDINGDHSQSYIKKMLEMSNMWLDKGRETLKNCAFSEAIQFFTLARRSYSQSVIPDHRWYKKANFAIATNRATTAMKLKEWNNMRSDIRFAVLMKPDENVLVCADARRRIQSAASQGRLRENRCGC